MCFRKEKKDKQQVATEDETILALKKKLEEKEQEYQRLKQSNRKRAKAFTARTARNRESNKEVSFILFIYVNGGCCYSCHLLIVLICVVLCRRNNGKSQNDK